MKFLVKDKNSVILKDNLVYKKGQSKNNRKLKDELLKEQLNFCAYTEKYIQELDASEVEHFNSSIKYNDNYYNYYIVIRRANQYKIEKDKKYKSASFFESLFFQDIDEFNKRIKFEDGYYSEVNENDVEAIGLIDFLGFNNDILYSDRKRHIKRLKRNFKDADYNKNEIKGYFKEHIQELSFITAIEYEFEIDLSDIVKV